MIPSYFNPFAFYPSYSYTPQPMFWMHRPCFYVQQPIPAYYPRIVPLPTHTQARPFSVQYPYRQPPQAPHTTPISTYAPYFRPAAPVDTDTNRLLASMKQDPDLQSEIIEMEGTIKGLMQVVTNPQHKEILQRILRLLPDFDEESRHQVEILLENIKDMLDSNIGEATFAHRLGKTISALLPWTYYTAPQKHTAFPQAQTVYVNKIISDLPRLKNTTKALCYKICASQGLSRIDAVALCHQAIVNDLAAQENKAVATIQDCHAYLSERIPVATTPPQIPAQPAAPTQSILKTQTHRRRDDCRRTVRFAPLSPPHAAQTATQPPPRRSLPNIESAFTLLGIDQETQRRCMEIIADPKISLKNAEQRCSHLLNASITSRQARFCGKTDIKPQMPPVLPSPTAQPQPPRSLPAIESAFTPLGIDEETQRRCMEIIKNPEIPLETAEQTCSQLLSESVVKRAQFYSEMQHHLNSLNLKKETKDYCIATIRRTDISIEKAKQLCEEAIVQDQARQTQRPNVDLETGISDAPQAPMPPSPTSSTSSEHSSLSDELHNPQNEAAPPPFVPPTQTGLPEHPTTLPAAPPPFVPPTQTGLPEHPTTLPAAPPPFVPPTQTGLPQNPPGYPGAGGLPQQPPGYSGFGGFDQAPPPFGAGLPQNPPGYFAHGAFDQVPGQWEFGQGFGFPMEMPRYTGGVTCDLVLSSFFEKMYEAVLKAIPASEEANLLRAVATQCKECAGTAQNRHYDGACQMVRQIIGDLQTIQPTPVNTIATANKLLEVLALDHAITEVELEINEIEKRTKPPIGIDPEWPRSHQEEFKRIQEAIVETINAIKIATQDPSSELDSIMAAFENYRQALIQAKTEAHFVTQMRYSAEGGIFNALSHTHFEQMIPMLLEAAKTYARDLIADTSSLTPAQKAPFQEALAQLESVTSASSATIQRLIDTLNIGLEQDPSNQHLQFLIVILEKSALIEPLRINITKTENDIIELITKKEEKGTAFGSTPPRTIYEQNSQLEKDLLCIDHTLQQYKAMQRAMHLLWTATNPVQSTEMTQGMALLIQQIEAMERQCKQIESMLVKLGEDYAAVKQGITTAVTALQTSCGDIDACQGYIDSLLKAKQTLNNMDEHYQVLNANIEDIKKRISSTCDAAINLENRFRIARATTAIPDKETLDRRTQRISAAFAQHMAKYEAIPTETIARMEAIIQKLPTISPIECVELEEIIDTCETFPILKEQLICLKEETDNCKIREAFQELKRLNQEIAQLKQQVSNIVNKLNDAGISPNSKLFLCKTVETAMHHVLSSQKRFEERLEDRTALGSFNPSQTQRRVGHPLECMCAANVFLENAIKACENIVAKDEALQGEQENIVRAIKTVIKALEQSCGQSPLEIVENKLQAMWEPGLCLEPHLLTAYSELKKILEKCNSIETLSTYLKKHEQLAEALGLSINQQQLTSIQQQIVLARSTQGQNLPALLHQQCELLRKVGSTQTQAKDMYRDEALNCIHELLEHNHTNYQHCPSGYFAMLIDNREEKLKLLLEKTWWSATQDTAHLAAIKVCHLELAGLYKDMYAISSPLYSKDRRLEILERRIDLLREIGENPTDSIAELEQEIVRVEQMDIVSTEECIRILQTHGNHPLTTIQDTIQQNLLITDQDKEFVSGFIESASKERVIIYLRGNLATQVEQKDPARAQRIRRETAIDGMQSALRLVDTLQDANLLLQELDTLDDTTLYQRLTQIQQNLVHIPTHLHFIQTQEVQSATIQNRENLGVVLTNLVTYLKSPANAYIYDTLENLKQQNPEWNRHDHACYSAIATYKTSCGTLDDMKAVCKDIIVYLVPTLSPSLLRRPEDDEDVSSISSYHTETPRSRPSTPVDIPRETPINMPHKAPPKPEICTPQAPHNELLPPKPATAVSAKPSSPPITPRATLDVSPLHQETRPEDPLKEKKLKLIRALLGKKTDIKAGLLDEAARKGHGKTKEETAFAQSLRGKDDAELKSLAYRQFGELIL